MKFAKYLEDNYIPEWKAAYFDYKRGKKLIKQVQAKQDHVVRGRTRDYLRKSSASTTPLVGSRAAASPSGYGSIATSGDASNIARIRASGREAYLSTPKIKGDISEPQIPEDVFRSPASSTEPAASVRRRSTSGRAPMQDGIELHAENQAQQTFYDFVDEQIRKIDEFYTEREADAGKRLNELRYQLQEMKDRKKLILSRRDLKTDKRSKTSDYTRSGARLYANLVSFFSYADIDHLNNHPIDDDPTAESATQLLLTYKVARRRLRIAIQEFYHSLELLQSYRTINRTALTKVLKKFDKTARVRSSPVFLEKLNRQTYIGTSEFLDKIMHDSENVYAKYYYNGDRKHAVTALRTKERTEDHRFTMLRIGIYLGIAVSLGLEGLVRSQVMILDDTERTYLLQIWGAFFLLILIVLLFGLNCYVWTLNKINYVFIFEYNVRHNLTWMQFMELPSFIALLFSIFFWMCFSQFFPGFTHWYPLLFLSITLIIILVPLPIFHFSTRRWFVNAHGRLLISGLATVRFQDVFLGDLYNSLTYSLGNTVLFFCVYRFNWNNPAQCGSSHSRLLGFFTTIPGILRLFQCLRRFYDTRHYFPHIANAGKYTMTIMQYTALSLWRVQKFERFKIVYIVFATINSCYTVTWDIIMDVSLLQTSAKPIFLRNDRAYRYTWVYYAFLILDPILRFSWIFYIIYSDEIQHAASLSFYIGLAEVLRRSMWSLFRVENEHMANVSTYRASRELPLPYAIHTTFQTEGQQRKSGDPSKSRTSQPRVAEAHATDFERKTMDGLHMDDVDTDSDRSDAEPPSNPDSGPDNNETDDIV